MDPGIYAVGKPSGDEFMEWVSLNNDTAKSLSGTMPVGITFSYDSSSNKWTITSSGGSTRFVIPLAYFRG